MLLAIPYPALEDNGTEEAVLSDVGSRVLYGFLSLMGTRRSVSCCVGTSAAAVVGIVSNGTP